MYSEAFFLAPDHVCLEDRSLFKSLFFKYNEYMLLECFVNGGWDG